MTIGANYRNWIAKVQVGENATFQYAKDNKDCKKGAIDFAKARIELVDINKNGGLDAREFAREYKVLFKCNPTDRAATLFKAADTDGNNVLDEKELASIILATDFQDGHIDGKMSYNTARTTHIIGCDFLEMTPQDFKEIQEGWFGE